MSVTKGQLRRKYKLYPSRADRRLAQLDKIVEALYLRPITTLVIITLVIVFFASLFTPPSTGNSAPETFAAISTRSAIGQPGTTSPAGLSFAKEIAGTPSAGTEPARKGVDTQVLADMITPKPAWTHMPLYTDPSNEASTYAATNPTAPDISYIARMGQVPVAEWFGDWNTDITSDVSSYVAAAAAQQAVPVLVLYNIPERDCGGYSTGGAASVSAYTQWVGQVANSIGNQLAVVILEPDALGDLDCLASSDQQGRLQAVSQAVTLLKAQPRTSVYIDAGTPVWQSTATMATRLDAANVAAADGFSLNVSYFLSTSQNQTYGDQLSSLIGYKHYVIDTSRNGGNLKVTGAQCNPSDAMLGTNPTTNTGDALNDALLWIKIPWESDGQCNGSPPPGVVYWSYAVQLAKNAGW